VNKAGEENAASLRGGRKTIDVGDGETGGCFAVGNIQRSWGPSRLRKRIKPTNGSAARCQTAVARLKALEGPLRSPGVDLACGWLAQSEPRAIRRSVGADASPL
jgi:hypothetical protein